MKPPVFLILLFTFYLPFIAWTQSCSEKAELIQRVKKMAYRADISVCLLYRDSLEATLADCLISLDASDASLWSLYLEIGYNYYACDPPINAIDYLQNALKAIENDPAPLPENVGRIHRLLANTYAYLGRRGEAFESMKTAITYFEVDNSSYLSDAYAVIANLFTDFGDYYQALTYLSKAEKIATPDPYNGFLIENARAITFDRLGNYQEALASYQKAMKYLVENGIENEPINYAKLHGEIGHVHLLMGNYQNAATSLNRALDLQLANPSTYPDYILTTYLYKAELEVQLNNYAQALNNTNNAFAIINSLDDLDYHLVSRLYKIQGLAHLGQNEFNQGIDDLQKAIEALVPSFKTQNRNNPILSLEYTGDKVDLRNTLDQKAIAFKERFEATNNLSDLEIAHDTYLTLDTLITQTRQNFKAVGSKYFLQKTIVPIYDQAIQVALALYDEKEERTYLEMAHQFIARNKSIILIEGLEDKKLKFAAISDQLVEEENRLLRNYNGWEIDLYNAEKDSSKNNLVEQIRDSLFNTKRAYDLLIQSFEKNYPNYFKSKYNYFPKLSIAEIQAKIAENRAVLEFFLGDRTLYVSVVTKDDFKIYPSLIPTNFDALCTDFIKMVRGESYENFEERFSKTSYELYQYLFESALGDLNPAINRLTIIPDDILLHVSFDALLTAPYLIQPETWSDAPYFINKYAHHQVYANSLLFDTDAQDNIEEASKGFLGFGLEYYDYATKKLIEDSLKLQRISGPLPFADDEVLGIQAIMGGDVILNQEATKDFFIDNAPDYNMLHLAMHGYSDEENHLNSALIFTKSERLKDSLLRVADIYSLDLSASLVYLSACQTNYAAVKKGEGMSSISRAFAYAGCPSIVASLWNIPDASSHKIAIAFYENLQEGQPKDMALRNAKLTYLENTKMNGALPNLWAQTIVIGDPSPLVKEMGFSFTSWLGMGAILVFFVFLFSRRKEGS